MSEQTITVDAELAERTRQVAEAEERTEREVVSSALSLYTLLDASAHRTLEQISGRPDMADMAEEIQRALARFEWRYAARSFPMELRERLVDMTDDEIDALANEAVKEVREYHRREQR